METIAKHIDKQTFKQIFRDHREEFRTTNLRYNTEPYATAVQKMLDCGDPEKMGSIHYTCMSCGATRIIGFSCKSSFCLSCAKPYTDRWVEFIGRRLFAGVTYRHIVLTVPEHLQLWFFRNPSLLSPIMRAGHACLSDVLSTRAKKKLDIGSIPVLQTSGRAGNYNLHLHILMTAGGIAPDGNWVNVNYIPYDLFHKKWQYHLLNMLRETLTDPAIKTDIDHCWETYPKGLVAHVRKGDVPPGGKGLAKYLAKYLVSPPISVRRIENYDQKSVRYWYRDHRTNDIQHETLPALRFIGRMVQHILPKGFQRIRYYGLHANVRYEKIREKPAEILSVDATTSPNGFRVIPRKPFAELFQKTFHKNPLLCPKCGTIMELHLIKHPKYGIIKDFSDDLMIKAPDEPKIQPEYRRNRGPLDRPERMVQVSLPFL